MTDRIRKLHYIKERKGIRSCSSGLPARIKYTIGGGRSNKILPSLLTSRPKHPDKAAGAFCIHTLSSSPRAGLTPQALPCHNKPSFDTPQPAVGVKATGSRVNTGSTIDSFRKRPAGFFDVFHCRAVILSSFLYARAGLESVRAASKTAQGNAGDSRKGLILSCLCRMTYKVGQLTTLFYNFNLDLARRRSSSKVDLTEWKWILRFTVVWYLFLM